jgi:hypothetical protein
MYNPPVYKPPPLYKPIKNRLRKYISPGLIVGGLRYIEIITVSVWLVSVYSGGNSLFPVVGGGAKPPKFPTKLSNFRHTPPFALEKTVFSPLLGQNFRKCVNFPCRWGGGGGGGGGVAPPPHQDFRH